MANARSKTDKKNAVHGGPVATRHADGRVLALTPSVYPELVEGDLYCAVKGHGMHPAGSFAFMAKKGSGRGRMVECRKAFEARLAANVEARAAGKPTQPAPHIDTAHVVPKPKEDAPKKASPAPEKAPAKAPEKAARPAATSNSRAIDVPSGAPASA